jgi:phosphatidylserine decarboxylase
VTRTGFDMDPFVVVSLGKKTFRTRHIRHSLNPVFDEKMLFHVLRHEQNYTLNFAVVDRDKFSSNDFVAETSFPVQQVQTTQPTADPETGLYYFTEPSEDQPPPSPIGGSPSLSNKSRFRLSLPRSTSGSSLTTPSKRHELAHSSSSKSLRSLAGNQMEGMEDSTTVHPSLDRAVPAPNIEYALMSYSIPLPLKHKERWEDIHKPELHFKIKYVPYPALRQQFWRHLLRQYDSDDSGMISRVELTTMLDSLGSTLHASTISSFFERYREANGAESLEATELTVDQAVICLEDQLTTLSQKGFPTSSTSTLNIPRLTISNRRNSADNKSTKSEDDDVLECQTPVPGSTNQSVISFQQQLVPGEEGKTLAENDLEYDGRSEEHVIQIKECPLCHQPRMNKRSEMDIVTHLATCASQDWRQVDKLVMGGFVTSSQAQRKWYSKVRALFFPHACLPHKPVDTKTKSNTVLIGYI